VRTDLLFPRETCLSRLNSVFSVATALVDRRTWNIAQNLSSRQILQSRVVQRSNELNFSLSLAKQFISESVPTKLQKDFFLNLLQYFCLKGVIEEGILIFSKSLITFLRPYLWKDDLQSCRCFESSMYFNSIPCFNCIPRSRDMNIKVV
jgi:hypothetical protein